MRLHPVRITSTAAIGTLLLLAAAVGASANPPLEDKRAQAQAIIAELQAIDEEVGAAAERFNGANYELQQLTAELTETRESITRARKLQKVAQRRVAARVRLLYMNGDAPSSLEVILGATSLDEMLDEFELAKRVARQDATIARQVNALRERVERREQELAAARERQAVVVEQRAIEKRAIESRLAERQRLLASVQDEIARLQEVERRRQAELRRQAALELERQRRAAEEEARARDGAEQSSAPAAASTSGLTGRVPIAPEYVAPPADPSKGAQVVAIALQYLGVPYKWGGASPETGFDCSGLTMYVYAQVGISLPHYAAAQYRMGVPVPKDQLQPGDLVFFRNLGHMGMYIGGGNFIHAPRTGDVVKISPLSDPYYVANWVGARRVL